MARDWSGREVAIAHFEKLVKMLKRTNDEDKDVYEEALNALRRSQDHTAIQTRLNQATTLLRGAHMCADLCGNCKASIDSFLHPTSSAVGKTNE